MRITFRFLLFIISLFILSSCSSAPEDTLEITINKENTESTSDKDEDSNPSVLKLDYYFELYHGNNYAEGAALYGDYLFQAEIGSQVNIYNFAEKKYITTLRLSNLGHADTMCFGIEKVDDNDEFPVLYISGSKVYEDGKRGNIMVYRILRETDEQGLEKWSGTLVQHIKTPDVAVVGSYPDIVIDEKGSSMWIIGWFQKMGYNTNDGSGCTYIFSKYQTPSITDGTKDKKGVYQLVLSEENRQSYFLLYDVHAITQGLCFYNGIIICPYGKPTVSYKGIDFVDVKKQQLIANVDLAGSIIYEAEGAVVVKSEMYIVGQRNFVYKCNGIDFNSLTETSSNAKKYYLK